MDIWLMPWYIVMNKSSIGFENVKFNAKKLQLFIGKSGFGESVSKLHG
jgi:hypothetical protein